MTNTYFKGQILTSSLSYSSESANIYMKRYKITKSEQGFQEQNNMTRKHENIKEDGRKWTDDDGQRIRQSRNTSQTACFSSPPIFCLYKKS